MARLIHCSDLHFGAHEPHLVEALEGRLAELRPDLVVISGDFTQRARTEQFEQACAFLARLRDGGHDVLAVPGNHDVPLYDVLRRFLSPLTRYRRFVDDSLCPVHELPGVTVLGINTARSLTFSDGRINADQMDIIRTTFAASPKDNFKVLVTHHPLLSLPVGEGADRLRAAGRSDHALDAAAEVGVDLMLAGHHHQASAHSARDLATRAGPALAIQAGTATSHRLRDEDQSFNLIQVARERVALTVHRWDGARFEAAAEQGFDRDGDHWRLAGAERILDGAG